MKNCVRLDTKKRPPGMIFENIRMVHIFEAKNNNSNNKKLLRSSRTTNKIEMKTK
jgi:hypothetical protein